MARYIDADNLINELSAACMPIYEKGITGILGDNSSIADIINEQPTADVKPVKRGTWENTNTPNQLRCSNCEIIHFIAQYPHGEINYCPNCGARLIRKKNKKNYKGGNAMSETVSGEELEKINDYVREPLTEDKVFVFRVALCDNDIDRDGEKFSSGALEKLAELFKGRTGIFDHDPKSSKQTARIFDTWVETLPEKTTTDGEVYRRLMAKAYMVRTASNGDLISEIQGGIKKEVSVSCTMGEKLCSVCGADMYKGGCDHEKGGEYGGKLCYHILDEPLDAYEWSFVAVPAQVNAGVTKRFTLREKHEGTDKSYELALAREAFEKDVLRLSYFCKPFMSAKRVKELAELMTVTELIDFRGRLEKQAAENEEVYKAERESFITGDYKM